MRICALMSFYDEPDEMLYESVRSLAGLADGIVALDGRYALFDGPDKSPRSNWDAIANAASSIGIPAEISCRDYGPWDGPHGGECAKRDNLFRLGEAATSADDWFLIWDADFVLDQELSEVGMARLMLERTRMYAADVFLLQGEECLKGRMPNLIHRLFFRALRDIRVGSTHWQWTAPNPRDAHRPLRLWDHANRPVRSEATYDHVIVHHVPDRRDRDRENRRWTYYIIRDSRRVEVPEIVEPRRREMDRRQHVAAN